MMPSYSPGDYVLVHDTVVCSMMHRQWHMPVFGLAARGCVLVFSLAAGGCVFVFGLVGACLR